MSRFDDIAAAGPTTALFALFGAAGTYTAPAGGAAIACTVMLSDETSEQVELGDGRYVAARRYGTIAVKSSQVASPARNGVFAIAGDDWRIRSAPRLDAGTWTCECELVTGNERMPRTMG